MVKPAANEAEPVLGGALRAMARIDSLRANAQELFDAWFTALESKGRGESVEALRAGLLYVRYGPRPGRGDPGGRRATNAFASRALCWRSSGRRCRKTNMRPRIAPSRTPTTATSTSRS